jgi:hypothetical protein
MQELCLSGGLALGKPYGQWNYSLDRGVKKCDGMCPTCGRWKGSLSERDIFSFREPERAVSMIYLKLAILPIHVIGLKFQLYSFPVEAVQLSSFCGYSFSFLKFYYAILIDAVFSYCKFLRPCETYVMMGFFISGFNWMTSVTSKPRHTHKEYYTPQVSSNKDHLWLAGRRWWFQF